MWLLGFELKEFNISVANVFFVLFLRAFAVFLGVEGDLARAVWSIWAHFKVAVQNADRRKEVANVFGRHFEGQSAHLKHVKVVTIRSDPAQRRTIHALQEQFDVPIPYCLFVALHCFERFLVRGKGDGSPPGRPGIISELELAGGNRGRREKGANVFVGGAKGQTAHLHKVAINAIGSDADQGQVFPSRVIQRKLAAAHSISRLVHFMP